MANFLNIESAIDNKGLEKVDINNDKKISSPEFKKFLETVYKKYKIEEEVLTDIINYQKARLHDPNINYPISKKFIAIPSTTIPAIRILIHNSITC
jgi:hypothetical protein